MRQLIRSIALMAVAAGLPACSNPKEPTAAPAPQQAAELSHPAPAVEAKPQVSAASRAEAKELFATRCMPCHGAGGAGDGPASVSLTPRPRNFTDREWQGKVTDEHIEKIIQYGGLAVGKSPAMPPNPDLTSKPETVAALREHIRSLKK